MKRLTNLKNSSSDPNKRNGTFTGSKNSKKEANNPYPSSVSTQEPTETTQPNDYPSFSEPNSGRPGQVSPSVPSFSESAYEQQSGSGEKSAAPTVSVDGETGMSEAAHSKAGTAATVGGGTHASGEESTFSSPDPSVRSLTTTLTTVQSTAPSNQIYTTHNPNQHNTYSNGSSHLGSTSNQQPGAQFSHQFPTSASAVPPHLAPHPTTYTAATANNLLTDNASMLTLASSSKRRRRNSNDTNASVRALPPSSLFSGSRESLPLSVLSGNAGNTNAATGGGADYSNTSTPNPSSVLSRSGVAGSAANERGSVNSVPDKGSIRSGRMSHHARNESTPGSMAIPGRISRRSSGWGEITGDEDDEDESQQHQQQKIGTTTAEHAPEQQHISNGKAK